MSNPSPYGTPRLKAEKNKANYLRKEPAAANITLVEEVTFISLPGENDLVDVLKNPMRRVGKSHGEKGDPGNVSSSSCGLPSITLGPTGSTIELAVNRLQQFGIAPGSQDFVLHTMVVALTPAGFRAAGPDAGIRVIDQTGNSEIPDRTDLHFQGRRPGSRPWAILGQDRDATNTVGAWIPAAQSATLPDLLVWVHQMEALLDAGYLEARREDIKIPAADLRLYASRMSKIDAGLEALSQYVDRLERLRYELGRIAEALRPRRRRWAAAGAFAAGCAIARLGWPTQVSDLLESAFRYLSP